MSCKKTGYAVSDFAEISTFAGLLPGLLMYP
jgi:hypothetical protein